MDTNTSFSERDGEPPVADRLKPTIQPASVNPERVLGRVKNCETLESKRRLRMCVRASSSAHSRW